MTIQEALQPLHGFFVLTSFIFGGLVGSFCNVCVCRWPSGESVVSPRSRCPKCMNSIAWYDNIPVLSWLLLGAKCRHCGLPISWQYPVVEAITAVLFALTYLRFGATAATLVYMGLCASMVIVVFQDLSDWTIPNEITLPGILAGVGIAVIGMFWPETGLRLIHPLEAIDGIVLGAFIICLLDGAVVLLLRKPGMGFGDMKLLAMLGAFLGWKGVLGTLMLASLLGSAVGLGMILYFQIYKDQSKTSSIPSDDDNRNRDPYPIDPMGSVILAASAVYLIIRVVMFVQSLEYGPLAELKPLLLTTPVFVSVLALFIAGLSLSIHAKQRKMPSHSGVEDTASDVEDGDISLQNHYLPFGPYLAAAGLFYTFYGPELINAYTAYLRAPLGP